jgi:hypothetical protein
MQIKCAAAAAHGQNEQRNNEPHMHILAVPCRRLFGAWRRMRNVLRFEFRDFLRRQLHHAWQEFMLPPFERRQCNLAFPTQ